jgi:AraC family transcriptional regulator
MNLAPSRYEQGRAMLLAGLRRHHSFAESARSVAAQWAAFRALGTLPGQRSATAYGIVCARNLDNGTFEFLSGVEVDDFERLPLDLARLRVPPQRYAVFPHADHVATLRATWEAIWASWLPGSGCAPADTPDIEVYDSRFDPVTGLGGIEIWFPLRED